MPKTSLMSAELPNQKQQHIFLRVKAEISFILPAFSVKNKHFFSIVYSTIKSHLYVRELICGLATMLKLYS